MRMTTAFVAGALLAITSLPAQDGTPAERVAQLEAKYKEADQQWMQAYRAASKEERRELISKRPNPDTYTAQFFALAGGNLANAIGAPRTAMIFGAACALTGLMIGGKLRRDFRPPKTGEEKNS